MASGPVGAQPVVQVRGLKDLNSAFRSVSKEMGKELRIELKDTAVPVRDLAERFAVDEIRNIGPKWSRFRIGANSKLVYVAPQQRRKAVRKYKSGRHTGSPRPNLALLLLERAMIPALEQEQPAVVARVERLFDRIARQNGF